MKLCDFEVGLDRPFFLIVGPCVIESREVAFETAGQLKEICATLGIPFIYKASYDKANRSSGKSFRGLGMDKGLEIQFPLTYYAGVRQVVNFDSITIFFAENLPKSIEAATKGGAKMVGPPCGFYWTYDTIAKKTNMAAVVPLDKQVKMGGGVQIFSVGGQQSRVIEHLGGYDKSGEAHFAMDEYIAEKKLQFVPPVVEEYVAGPGTEPDTLKWLTRVIYFVEPKRDSTAATK